MRWDHRSRGLRHAAKMRKRASSTEAGPLGSSGGEPEEAPEPAPPSPQDTRPLSPLKPRLVAGSSCQDSLGEGSVLELDQEQLELLLPDTEGQGVRLCLRLPRASALGWRWATEQIRRASQQWGADPRMRCESCLKALGAFSVVAGVVALDALARHGYLPDQTSVQVFSHVDEAPGRVGFLLFTIEDNRLGNLPRIPPPVFVEIPPEALPAACGQCQGCLTPASPRPAAPASPTG